ncbi:hypothetical protein [Tabrizicola sp.]|uniref:hypothetical protein n=1 Tax=Tabrizicola sp. TaxID=2005166 RepID=UPI002FDD666C
MRALLALLLSATPVLAEPVLTADEFDTLTRGRIMTWSEFGAVYGVEQYLPGRKVRWTVLGDDCKTGHWYQDGAAICFQYEDDIDPDCWEITRSGADLLARYTTDPPGTEPVIVAETTEPLACFGPEVGV